MKLFEDVRKERDPNQRWSEHWIEAESLFELQKAYDYARHRADYLGAMMSGMSTEQTRELHPLYVQWKIALSDADFYKQAVELKAVRPG